MNATGTSRIVPPMTVTAPLSSAFVSPYTGAEDAAIVARRRRILDRVPTRVRVRVRLLEAKVDRERFVNAGLRARLGELDATLDGIAIVIDEQARILGHAHPAIVRVRALLDAAAS